MFTYHLGLRPLLLPEGGDLRYCRLLVSPSVDTTDFLVTTYNKKSI